MDCVAIIGLGYVGLPLSLQFARRGIATVGLDIDEGRIEALRTGRSYLEHIADSEVRTLGAREHPEWTERQSVTWARETISAFDLNVIVTAHTAVNYVELGARAPLIVDMRNAMAAGPMPNRSKVWKA